MLNNPIRRLVQVLLLAALGLSGHVAQALTTEEAAHLLRRTGFEATPAQISALLPLDRAQAVDRLIAQARRNDPPAMPLPAWADEPIEDRFIPRGMKGQARKDYRRQMLGRRSVELQEWWLQEMRSTQVPLRERMTLFWHAHFTSELRKVKWAQLMLRQNQLFRRQGLGNYRELLRHVSRDPAMLIYLDNIRNVAGQPNENYARELLELFTLGEGHYSERDVSEAARAFSGWRMLPPQGRFHVDPALHDAGEKVFLGQRGRFDGDDVIDLILRHPRASNHLAERYWQEFVAPTPDPVAIKRLAAAFARDWELAGLLRDTLLEPAFWDPANRALLVKSPVELVIGTARLFELPLQPAAALLATDSMGQSVFNPPNVKGWPRGVGWIGSQTLLARTRFIEYLVGDAPDLSAQQRTSPAFAKRTRKQMLRDQKQMVRAVGTYADEDSVERLAPLLLATAPVLPPQEGLKPPERLERWLLDLSYQLK